jgi:tryptophanase
MPRITPIHLSELTPASKLALDNQHRIYDEPVSSMQATLLHSPQAYAAYMQWYPLHDAIENILGKRLAYLFAWSISKGSECTYCSTIFRKKIIDGGENPEALELSSAEKNLVDFGSAVSRCQGNIANHLFNSISAQYNNEELVTLIAFAGQMIAANIFNNVAETCMDEHLQEYIPEVKSIWQ